MSGEKQATASVRLDADVVETARIVAAFRGDSIAHIASGLLRPLLRQMERDAIEQRTKSTRNPAVS